MRALDEEDQIEHDMQERMKQGRGTGTQPVTKYERHVRTGKALKDDLTLGFANYFTAQKVRAKVTQAEEQRGNQQLLKQ